MDQIGSRKALQRVRQPFRALRPFMSGIDNATKGDPDRHGIDGRLAEGRPEVGLGPQFEGASKPEGESSSGRRLLKGSAP